MALARQGLGVALASDDGADDGLSGLAHHVADHLGQLDVHLDERFLHALHPAGLLGEQNLALTRHRADHAYIGAGAKRRAQQPVAHQPLQPLAVLHVALAPGDVLDLASINQPDLQASLLEHFVHRDPVHPGGLQRYRIDAARQQPVRQRVQIIGHRTEFAHRRIRAVRRHRRPVARCPNVNPGCIGGNLIFSLVHCHRVLHHG